MATERIRPGARVVFRQFSDETGGVLLNLETGSYHSLNQTGALIWASLATETTLDELVEDVRTATGGPESGDLPGDVTEFVMALAERGLVVIEAG